MGTVPPKEALPADETKTYQLEDALPHTRTAKNQRIGHLRAAMGGCGGVVTRHVSFRQRTGGRKGGGETGPRGAQPQRSAAWSQATTVSTQVGSRSPENKGRRRNQAPSDSRPRKCAPPRRVLAVTPSLEKVHTIGRRGDATSSTGRG